MEVDAPLSAGAYATETGRRGKIVREGMLLSTHILPNMGATGHLGLRVCSYGPLASEEMGGETPGDPLAEHG